MKLFAYVGILVLLLAGCQTTAPTTPTTVETPAVETPAETPAPVPTPETVPDLSTITAGTTGFSPLAQNPANTMPFALHFGSPSTVTSWKVEFVGDTGVMKTVTGTSDRLPPTLTWDGEAEDETLVANGNYLARLTVDSGDVSTSVESAPFLVDIIPPSATLTVDPQPFQPGDPDITVNPPKVNFSLSLIPGGAPITTWRLAVLHPDGRRFMDFISEAHTDNKVEWNGRNESNNALEGGTTYRVSVQVYDRYGNVGTVEGIMPVIAAPVVAQESGTNDSAAPVTVNFDGKLIAGLVVYFPPFSADLAKVQPFKLELNRVAFDTLAAVLKAAPDHPIRVIGHANKIYWNDQAKGDAEQTAVLIPLSLARANAVRDALAQRGVSVSAFTLVGVGADDPLAPFEDAVNNWKNRRVEFVAP